MLIKNDVLKMVYPLSIIIVMAYNYRPIYIGAMSKLFYTENTKLAWRISFVAGISNIILNLIFIPIYGFEVAAITTFCSLMYMGFAGHFIKKISSLQSVNYYPVFWLGLIIIATILAYYAVELNVVYKLCISFLVLLTILFCANKFKTFIK